jgi:hypothetical protein
MAVGLPETQLQVTTSFFFFWVGVGLMKCHQTTKPQGLVLRETCSNLGPWVQARWQSYRRGHWPHLPTLWMDSQLLSLSHHVKLLSAFH